MIAKHKVNTSDFLVANPVFSLDDAEKALAPAGGRRAAIERLKYHREAGRIKLIAREVYAVVPPGIDAVKFQPDPFLVGSTVRPAGVFAYHSALELLGAAHSVWNECALFVERRRRKIDLSGVTVRFLDFPKPLRKRNTLHLGTQKVEHRGRLLRVTGPERTLVEGFRRPGLVGGAEELVRSASGFSTLDLQLLEKLLDRFKAKNLWAAIGWFLESHRRAFHVSDTVLDRFKRRRPRSPQYLERGSRDGSLAAGWNIILPRNLMRMSEPDERES